MKKNKQVFKNAGFSLAVTAIVIAIVIFANVLVSAVPTQYTQFDMTKNSLYTATSKETKDSLAALDYDLTIYYICGSGREDLTVKSFVDNYASLSDRIAVKRIDPLQYPNFSEQYGVAAENLYDNTVIMVNESLQNANGEPLYYVINGGKHSSATETTGLSEFYQWDVDMNTYYSTGQVYYYTSEFKGEQRMATAVNYVTNTVWPQCYVLTGHGEPDITEMYTGISNDVIRFQTLILGDKVPDDCDAIIICSPSQDISAAEAQALIDYLNRGGDIIFMLEHTDKEMTNLSKVFDAYGFSVTFDEYIRETNAGRLPQASAPYIFAPYHVSDAVFELFKRNNLYAINMNAMPIVENASHRSSVIFTELLYTDTGVLTRFSDDTEDGEAAHYVTGAHISEAFDDVEANIYVFTGRFYDQLYNYLIISDVLKNTCSVTSVVDIPGVDMSYDQLVMLESESRPWKIIVQFVVPLTILAAGIIVFVVRRRK